MYQTKKNSFDYPQVVILEHKSIICAGYSAVLHIHNVVEECTFVVREHYLVVVVPVKTD